MGKDLVLQIANDAHDVRLPENSLYTSGEPITLCNVGYGRISGNQQGFN